MLHARAMTVRPTMWITNGSPGHSGIGANDDHCMQDAGAVGHAEQLPFTQPAHD
jgi:hypothetical protein